MVNRKKKFQKLHPTIFEDGPFKYFRSARNITISTFVPLLPNATTTTTFSFEKSWRISWSMPTVTGFNQQHKRFYIILRFCTNSLLRVVCQLSSVDISASTILLTSHLKSSRIKPIKSTNFSKQLWNSCILYI